MSLERKDEEGRRRLLTDKGLGYQRDMKMTKRKKLLNLLSRQSVDLNRLLSESTDQQVVKNNYSDWLSTYEELLITQEECLLLLDAEEIKEEKMWFDSAVKEFRDLKSLSEHWFLTNSTHYKDEVRSTSSKRSSVGSRASSQITLERLKESQKKAELLARASALAEKQKLEEDKLKLKMKEEELEIRTELNVSDAKTKALELLERSLLQNEEDLKDLQENQTNTKDIGSYMISTPSKNERVSVKDKYSIHTDHREVQFAKSAPDRNNQQFDESNISLMVSRELNKPKSEIVKFDGNPLDYNRFLRQFNSRVCANTDSYEEKLNFLLQFTCGKANRIVAGYSNLNSEKGYKAAMEEFTYRYGDSNIIAQAYVKKALNWPVVKADDPKALDDLYIFLMECLFAVGNSNASSVLEYPDNLKIIVQKLPFYLHDKWRNIVYEHRIKGNTVQFETLVSFIRKEAKKANDPIYGKEMFPNKQSKTASASSSNKTSKTMTTVVKDTQDHGAQNSTLTRACAFCKGQHYLSDCSNITLNALTDRFNFLKINGLCFGCLRSGHVKRECRKKKQCAKCQRLHPTILHVDPRDTRESQYRENAPENTASSERKSYATHTGAGAALPVVPVRLKAKSSDKFIETYAFLDSGSTATFCSERILDLLGMEGTRTKINVVTLGNDTTQELREIRGLEISSLSGDNTVELPPVLTQPTLPISRTDVPSEKDIAVWPYLQCIHLERIESEVDLLIGINVPKAMEPWDVIPSEGSGPFAIKTIFGWVVNGPLDGDGLSQTVRSNYIRTTLDDQLREHFNRDFSELTINDKPEHSREDKQFMESVTRSITKREGHYTVDLPFKPGNINMPNNRNQAKQRLTLLSKRFDKDPRFREAYTEFMIKVIDKGYAQRVSLDNIPESGKVWYLPHHGVFHPKKNKIRVVFDCAARYGGTSLNDQLLQGPNLTSSLVGTLTRFRQEPVAVMGDIESMFCQIHVPPKDRNFQRFLWWNNGDTSTEPVEFQMTVHLFGATSSPSCASFALHQTTEDRKGHFNDEVIDTVLRNFYVDDCLKSVEAEHTATSLIKDLQAILKDGGFHITKWVSNSRKVMTSVPASERAAEVRDLDLDADKLPVERTLGVNWSVESDAFSFTVDVKDHAHTRRGILSTISSIYDPLGFIAPMIFSGKSMLQELCLLQISWDDPIPEKYEKKWCKWLHDITDLCSFEVARCFKPAWFGAVASSELHHFADASEKGYGTVSYLRLVNSEGNVHCSFVMGKSRVAPLKKVTIPRLELTAATVAVRIDKVLKQELDVKIDKTTFWTDSMSVLRYIRNSTSRFHTFVANRLNVIHEASVPEQWRYVSTKLNPADVASRGMPVDKVQWTNGWIEAPSFLLLAEDSWPIIPENIHGPILDDPEVKKVVASCAKVNQNRATSCTDCEDQLINYHSSWYKLKRCIGWFLKVREELLRRASLRSGKDIPAAKTTGYENRSKITTSDLRRAEAAVVKYVQNQAFSQEVQALENGKSRIRRDSIIRKLDPVFENGILRVGGRLHKSSMPAEHKHPVILPKGHHLTVLVLRQMHEDLMHAGRNHMLAVLRQQYWVVNAPSTIRKLLSKCVTCRRYKAPVGEQKMANLPEDRVTPDEPPFTRVGVDYFGPFAVKVKRSHVKRYGAIFTCLASRAVHIEVAHSLDTDSYINALRRFIARRGQVQKMISDNGTNFVGAEREIREALSAWNIAAIDDAMKQKNIEWQFNPPAGSHFGGVWERLIRSIRNAINSTVREQVLDDERLVTLLCEVEAVLNSRPITRISDQSNDLEALTPNHLLLQKKVPTLPPGLFDKADNYARRRWRQVQYMSNIFWRRWVREYLPILQERQKWTNIKRNLSVGDVVLVVDSNAPRNSWPLAVVKATMPDKTGLVRQVTVKTATNTLIRPIDKLCLILEID